MMTVRKPALFIGLGIAIFTTAATVTSTLLRLQPALLANISHTQGEAGSPEADCKTITTDPKPPLNVRLSPVVAPDNVIGTLRNGVQVTVIDENEGWLRISTPLEGWIYKNLTITSCVPITQVSHSTATDSGINTLTQATEYYQAGNLNAAIALAQTVPSASPTYQPAQAAIAQWQRDWEVAEAEFHGAQKALSDGRLQDALSTVKNFPDNRFWRTKLTPIIKEAIKRQHTSQQ